MHKARWLLTNQPQKEEAQLVAPTISTRKKVLVTGVAGFIGFHLARRMLAEGAEVLGIDNLNDYYDTNLKAARLGELDKYQKFCFLKADIANASEYMDEVSSFGAEIVYHLAAQAGVRYSIENPAAYITSNIVGFAHILEYCRRRSVKHFIYASSSSVYGLNQPPFRAADNTDHPVSLYAATKKANEAMAHSYSHLYGIPTTGLRFFTVYGPWGRPDMALWLFSEAILSGKPIRLFNNGNMERDFTYIDDVVEGICRIGELPPAVDAGWVAGTSGADTSSAPWRIYNIGNSTPVPLIDLVRALEKGLGREAVLQLEPMQPGDVEKTEADVVPLQDATGFRPEVDLNVGVANFCRWFLEWRSVSSNELIGGTRR